MNHSTIKHPSSLRVFHNWVKSQVISAYANQANTLLDIGIGFGGDLPKWNANGIQRVIGFDIDCLALEEVKARLIEHAFDRPQVECYDLDCGKESIAKFLAGRGITQKFSAVSSNFCLNHFFVSEQYLQQYLKNIVENCQDGAYYFGAVFDGQALFNLLKETQSGAALVRYDSGHEIYQVIKHYDDVGKQFSEMSLFNEKVTVYLPNSVMMNYGVLENLVNFDQFVHYANQFGLQLVETQMFSEWYPGYLKKRGLPLTEVEQEFSFLNRTFVFKYKK